MNAFAPGGAAPTAGDAAPAGAHAETHKPTTGVLDEFSSALSSAHGAFSNFLELLTLEARRAGLALTWMIAFGVVAAICIVTAWLGLMFALAMAAMSMGVPAPAAVLAVAVINGAAGIAFVYVCIGMSQSLLFSATRRQVGLQCPVKPSAS
jgi:hypothetical protein